MKGGIGDRRRRVEDPPLVQGRGRFAGDLRLPQMVHLAAVRSPFGHARIRGIDTAAARALPGVLAVWTVDDLPGPARVLGEEFLPGGLEGFPRPVLASGEVRYGGEILAAVIAETPAVAADAVDLVELDLEPLPAAASVEAAIAPGGPPVHPEVPANVAFSAEAGFGDVDAAFGGAPVIVKRRLRLPRIMGAAMEPRATTATPHDEGVRLWTSTQSVFSVRSRVAHALDLPEPAVEVRAENVGGGFGPKGRTYPEEILTAVAAHRLQRPVRWVATRGEDTAATVHAHGNLFDLELAAERDGTLRGLRGEFWQDLGAYATIGAGIAGNVATHLLSGYRHPAVAVRYHTVFTHAMPTGTVRGGGRPVGNFAIERMMDALADETGISRVEVRRRNLVPPSAMPYETGLRRGPAAVVYDSGDYPHLLEEAVARAGEPSTAPAGRRRGIGISFGVESTGFGSGEPARVRLLPDGTAELHLGSTPQGQGHETFAGQVLAERLGWPLERVRVFAGDTRSVPGGGVTAGSRSAVHVGSAISVTAVAVREELLRRAGERLEVAASDLVLGLGMVAVRGVPGRALAATELLDGAPLDITRSWETQTGTAWAASCHAVEVEVDPETGHVAVVRYVVVHDSGREINPRLVEGQLHGGLVHGIGYALFEEALYDGEGRFQTSTFLDYTLASAPEIAFVPELVSQESHTGFNPESVKGVGEAGTIPAPAAVLSAIENALRPTHPRVRLDRIPVTPERLLTALATTGVRGRS